MEPMELDEDSSSHTPPPPAFPPRLADRLTYPGSHSVPAYSPLLTHPASGTLSGFSPARTLLSSTPQHSAASPYRGERSPFCRSATFHGWQDSSFASPAPPQRSFSREASLPRAVVGGVERREVMTSPGDSLTSMETSDQSDVSEMEVVHNSPSPSWDRVRSVLSSFSLFKQETESEQGSVTGSVPVGVVGGPLEEEGVESDRGHQNVLGTNPLHSAGGSNSEAQKGEEVVAIKIRDTAPGAGSGRDTRGEKQTCHKGSRGGHTCCLSCRECTT
ncbi:uncharacterized protein LOC143289624 [Babylonia areolata]|uniref:uncharacterized protein LOC143289624 n=1 Tax=Babylonia areolata TaxID=304850 RepID=UPI003FD5BD9D